MTATGFRFSVHRLALLALALGALSSAGAAPRAVVPEDAQVEFVVREMGVPVPGRFKRFEAVVDLDPAAPERSSAPLLKFSTSMSAFSTRR